MELGTKYIETEGTIKRMYSKSIQRIMIETSRIKINVKLYRRREQKGKQ